MAKKKKKNWIPKNLKKGALRATAKRMKLIKGSKQKLSNKDLSIMAKKAKKTGNTLLARRVSLAKTFKKMRKG
tara:strand:- start:347 stop:565 length:219 start_codon:yes stop_codon:yes gene_type:complete